MHENLSRISRSVTKLSKKILNVIALVFTSYPM